MQKYSALHIYYMIYIMMPFVPSTTQFWVQFCQTMSLLVVHFQVCWLIIIAEVVLLIFFFLEAYCYLVVHHVSINYSGGWQSCQLYRHVLVAARAVCQYQEDF